MSNASTIDQSAMSSDTPCGGWPGCDGDAVDIGLLEFFQTNGNNGVIINLLTTDATFSVNTITPIHVAIT